MKPTNKTPDEFVYKPLKRSDKNWHNVVNNGNKLIPPPQFFIENGLEHKFSFGKCEVEEAARLLVKFFAEKKEWRYFTLEELEKFCKRQNAKSVGSALFGLICPWLDDGGIGCYREVWPYVVQMSETHFSVTTTFIKRLMPNGITKNMLKQGK